MANCGTTRVRATTVRDHIDPRKNFDHKRAHDALYPPVAAPMAVHLTKDDEQKKRMLVLRFRLILFQVEHKVHSSGVCGYVA